MQFFTMIFAAGVAVGIFYYGVAEPLFHQKDNWFAAADFRTQDGIDRMAMNYTLLHWGVAAWSVYIVVAVTTALAAYRFKLPLTFRSCFYPILGEYVWGWVGDVIDGFSIVVTVAGVCTSLGLGAIQMTAGFQRLGWVQADLSEKETNNVQSILIWVITGIATASVISGLGIGVKYLSMFAFGLGMLLTILVLTLEKTSFILNLQVESIGYYIQNSLVQLAFHTDAFGQLREGEGRAVDDEAAAVWWMEAWTIFYWNVSNDQTTRSLNAHLCLGDALTSLHPYHSFLISSVLIVINICQKIIVVDFMGLLRWSFCRQNFQRTHCRRIDCLLFDRSFTILCILVRYLGRHRSASISPGNGIATFGRPILQ